MLPILSFGQYSFLVNDFQLFDNNSISEIIKEAKSNGYEIMNANDGSMLKKHKIHPIIELHKKIGSGTWGYNIGYIRKVLYLYDDNLDDVNIWKVENVVSLYPYANISKSNINKRFVSIEGHLKKSLKKAKYKISEKSNVYNFKDSYDNNYNILENYEYVGKKSQDTIIISFASSSSKVLNKKGEYTPIERLYFSSENYIYSSFLNLLEKVASQTSTKSVNELRFKINNKDIREINIYDLEAMIDIFIYDCRKHNIIINKNQKVYAKFEELDDPTIALAYGLGYDDEIIIKVDPVAWKNASIQKKWYVLYHELGHDVLNFEHGQAGKMMFNFADRDYTWEEFFEDKEYMFNVKIEKQ